MNISEELKEKAVSVGLCTEWTEEWGTPDKDELVQKYIRGIDFCIEKNFPTNDYIKKNFGAVAEKHGVYVDKKIDISDPLILVLNGKCTGKVYVGGYSVSTIYVRHKADINIEVGRNARVFIHLHDKAKVNISCYGKAFVYRHGGTVSASGDVVVRDRQ